MRPKFIYEKGVVWDNEGNTVGFRCETCGKIVQSMFGDDCNKCVDDERKHKELISAIKGLK